MKIAVEGCAHGELEKIYEAIEHLQEKENVEIDLLICCGDFQATRNAEDLQCMAVPRKYQSMCSFYKYYTGEKVAPILTIFIGGNHEASNHLQELPYGGWVAPNIYYLGYASVVNVAGVRIGGLSGIYKGHDYMKGHFEKPPYTEETKRSVYHIRNLEVFRLKQLQEPIDIFLSHDWPRGIYQHGDTKELLKRKPFFSSEIESNTLGSKPCEELLRHLKPKFWFAAHMHVKFAAIYPHNTVAEENEEKITKFLALDKCLPRRQFLQVLDIPHDTNKPVELEYDLEWLTILHATNHLLSVKKGIHYMPGPGNNERWTFAPTTEEKDLIRKKFDSNLRIPSNFCRTVIPFDGNTLSTSNNSQQPFARVNPQTTEFCEKVGIDDPLAILLMASDGVLCGTDLYSPNNSQHSVSSLPSFLTPEKPGDLTQVSLSPGSEDLTQDTLSPRPARLSLVLPSPRHSDANEIMADADADAETVQNNGSCSVHTVVKRASLILPSPLSSDAEEKNRENCGKSPEADRDSLCRDILHEESTADEGTEKSPQQVKKFKRRNEAFYVSNVDDE
ncbi:lariat debranching enzyme isoform X2 [Schistocerca nitens]|uniref:lariat debranching enzyme isoform X2 n=1 Tax=Schistocerca nitens TaxID=7011 RepID=UPI0021190CF8|nr:lariat debranching enzyme isoform X2 [Schistocerca nitens]